MSLHLNLFVIFQTFVIPCAHSQAKEYTGLSGVLQGALVAPSMCGAGFSMRDGAGFDRGVCTVGRRPYNTGARASLSLSHGSMCSSLAPHSPHQVH